LIDAQVYGSATTRLILQYKLYKHSLHVHIYTHVAFYEIVLEKFFKANQDLKVECVDATTEIQITCSEKNNQIKGDLVKSANIHLLQTMTN